MGKISICERIFAAVLAVTIPGEFIGVIGMESDAGPWAWWLGISCAVLQLTAMVMVKVAWEREKRSSSICVPRHLIHRKRSPFPSRGRQ